MAEFYGTAGNDNLPIYEGFYIAPPEHGDDLFYGFEGDDTLSGGSGNDILSGGSGNDLIYGHEDNDSLYGNVGSDELSGGPGTDYLNGYGGTSWEYDTLLGGSGTDYFALGDWQGVSYLGGGYATIIGWEWQYDYIETYGDINQYSLDFDNYGIGNEAYDTGIYYGSNLIAIVQDSTEVNIARDFTEYLL
jgi:hypothetical protein